MDLSKPPSAERIFALTNNPDLPPAQQAALLVFMLLPALERALPWPLCQQFLHEHYSHIEDGVIARWCIETLNLA